MTDLECQLPALELECENSGFGGILFGNALDVLLSSGDDLCSAMFVVGLDINTGFKKRG